VVRLRERSARQDDCTVGTQVAESARARDVFRREATEDGQVIAPLLDLFRLICTRWQLLQSAPELPAHWGVEDPAAVEGDAEKGAKGARFPKLDSKLFARVAAGRWHSLARSNPTMRPSFW
jgi:hypothetical protein